jgi:hypothetical protein
MADALLILSCTICKVDVRPRDQHQPVKQPHWMTCPRCARRVQAIPSVIQMPAEEILPPLWMIQ